MVWLYIQKRVRKGSFHRYSFEELDQIIAGNLIVVDHKKNKYIFQEEAMYPSAGKILIDILQYDPSAFIGYDRFTRKLYQNDFTKMAKMRDIMYETQNGTSIGNERTRLWNGDTENSWFLY